MKAFPLNFMVGGGFLLTDSFHRFSGEKSGELQEILVCAVFIYLFVCYLFIYCLFVCLLFNYFNGAVCCFMHQLCGLAPCGLGGAISVFWWVSSGLICSPLDLMQGKM